MFGRPSQLLLPSRPPAEAGGSSAASGSHTNGSVQPPPSFKDFRFNSIGKQPELLSRISSSQPDHANYRSSPILSTSTPTSASNDAFRSSKLPSRQAPFEQLAGGNASSSPIKEGSGQNTSTSQPNRSLASRIQMDSTPSNDVANTAPHTASRFPSPPLRINSVRRATENANLIPPVEVLPQQVDSSPTTPLPLAVVHTPTSPLIAATMPGSSQIPTPPSVSTNVAAREPMESIPPSAAEDAVMQEPQPTPYSAAIIGSLMSQQERLQSISASLEQLAPPSQSLSPHPSSISQVNDSNPHPTCQPQHGSNPIILRHPYLATQSSGRVGQVNDSPTSTNDPPLTLVHPPAVVARDHRAQRDAVIEAVQSLLDAVHRAQIDSENALAIQMLSLEERRVAFEETKRAEEATLREEFQELQRKREELDAKEASLASLEQESKTREVARKAMLAKRQAQEEEKRVAEKKRTREVQEQIAAAMTVFKEIEALGANCQSGQSACGTVPDDLPTEPQQDMDEEEIEVIKSRHGLLRAVKHLRRMHADKMQKLDESSRTLRRLGEARRQKQAEGCRVAEEGRPGALAEAEWAHQNPNETQRQFEAEREHQGVENDRWQARLSVEHQAHAEAQAHDLRGTEASSGQTIMHPGRSEEPTVSQQQDIADVTRIRAANSHRPEAAAAMDVDEDGTAPHRAILSPDIHISPRDPQGATPQSKQKKDRFLSGNVTLATPKASAGHLPLNLSSKMSLLSTSDHVGENTLNPARASPIVASTDGGHKSLPTQPGQPSLELDHVVNADVRRTPDPKSTLSQPPKSRTLLAATLGKSTEFNIGPVTGVSPTQQNVNLRHLKRNRSRVDENDSGDRSVRTNAKIEENTVSVKKEEYDQSHQLMGTPLSTNPLASLPPRPVIPPPRPRKYAAPTSHTDSTPSYPHEGNEPSLMRGQAIIPAERPRGVLSPGNSSSQATNPIAQLSVPAETAHSLPLGPAYPEQQLPESSINVGERPIQGRTEKHDTISSEPATAARPHESERDPSRSDGDFTDEHRRARGGSTSRRLSDHHNPSSVTSRSTVASSNQPYDPIDSWRPQYSSNEPRAGTMPATSPTTGRKRSFEFDDNEHGHPVRRQRGDVWIAQSHDRDRVDSYRPHRDRRPGPDPNERRAAHPAFVSPSSWVRPGASDASRANNDSRSHIVPSEEPTASRWEQPSRRSENDDTYQRYQPSAPGYDVSAAQYHTDDVRVNPTYEPTTETRMEAHPDTSLWATRMSNTQRLPHSTSARGRGRGEQNRGRSDSGRARGRGVARGGPTLLDRLTSGPPSLGDRLS